MFGRDLIQPYLFKTALTKRYPVNPGPVVALAWISGPHSPGSFARASPSQNFLDSACWWSPESSHCRSKALVGLSMHAPSQVSFVVREASPPLGLHLLFYVWLLVSVRLVLATLVMPYRPAVGVRGSACRLSPVHPRFATLHQSVPVEVPYHPFPDQRLYPV